MAFKIKKLKVKEPKTQVHNPYFVDGKDVSKEPIYLLEEGEDSGLTPKQFQALWQYGVDTGIVWKLQDWYGRTAQDLLDSGYIKYPKERTHDYYGNKIPTQKEAKQGHFDK
jgi:hypothetical protein